MRGKETPKVYFDKVVYYEYDDKTHYLYRTTFGNCLNSSACESVRGWQVGKNMFTWKRAANEEILFVGFNTETRDFNDMKEFLKERGILYRKLIQTNSFRNIDQINILLDSFEDKVEVWQIKPVGWSEELAAEMLKVPASKASKYHKTKTDAEKSIISRYQESIKSHRKVEIYYEEQIKRTENSVKDYKLRIAEEKKKIEIYESYINKLGTMRNRIDDLRKKRSDAND